MDLFHPPFCANQGCEHHDPAKDYSQYIAWGSYQTRTFGTVPRFRCLLCGKTFSSQTFRVDYYAKRLVDYENLSQRISSCESLSAIGRAIHASTDSVSNRVSRAARQVLALESELQGSRTSNEDLAADGFESFCVSQYFPNHITLLIGSDSQFVYAADHAALRRKGRMTEEQRKKRKGFDAVFQPPPRAIEDSFALIALEMLRIKDDGIHHPLTLWTDEHQAYPRALARNPHIARLLESGEILHRTISSRKPRTLKNPLFPVNYLDREIRKDLHEHVRETVCFGRNVNRQMERLTLYLFWHNYKKPHRARGRPESHALVAGYSQSQIEEKLPRVWTKRAWHSLIELADSMEKVWRHLYSTPLAAQVDYLPAYALK